MKSLPSFELNEFENLITSLHQVGYGFDLISNFRSNVLSLPTIYLRHDIDVHIAGIERIAEIEAANNVTATYYVLLTQHYNPMQTDNRKILRRLIELGHEIGLHYDLATYPQDLDVAQAHLRWEAAVLAEIVGAPIRTITMHQPHKGLPDPFLMQDEYIHPHSPKFQADLVYVSDSCRAWRDETLLNCFGPNPPRRLLLTTHPELWLKGTVNSRMAYLQILTENATRPYRNYIDKIVRQVWLAHPGPRLHDERERRFIENSGG